MNITITKSEVNKGFTYRPASTMAVHVTPDDGRCPCPYLDRVRTGQGAPSTLNVHTVLRQVYGEAVTILLAISRV